MKKIGIIGSGVVAEALANGFLRNDYEVMMGTRNLSKLENWKKRSGQKAWIGSFEQATRFGEIVVIAVKGSAAESALELCKPENLTGKTVIDVTNPIADEPPQNGVIRFFTNINDSLMERLQKKVPKANFVKAFSCVGNAFMVDPDFGEEKPTMFICGNNDKSKEEVKEILTQFGWETEDMGSVEAARAIEPLCMLWCIPGLRNNQWYHAFRLLKKR